MPTLLINNIHHQGSKTMKFKVIVHSAEEGGYWAEVPALPGCITEESIRNMAQTFQSIVTSVGIIIAGIWFTLIEQQPGVRISYLDGVIELMILGEEHETIKSIIAILLGIYFWQKGIEFIPVGSATRESLGHFSRSYCLTTLPGLIKEIP
jgi:predicted RNase H-like HicB family nuclease